MMALGRQIRDSGNKLPHVLIPVTIVISSLAAGHVSGSTFALSHDTARGPQIEFQTLTTSQVLRFSSGRVQLVTDSGPDRVGSEVVRTFQIMNISDRHVSLSVELSGIPWARAELSRTELGPGETADIFVTGTPDQAGEYQGYLTVYGMGGFLELGMEFVVVVVPAPELDPCLADTPVESPARDGGTSGPPAPAVEEPVMESGDEDSEESPAFIIGLHPDLLGLPMIGDGPGDEVPPPIARPEGEVPLPDTEPDDETGGEPDVPGLEPDDAGETGATDGDQEPEPAAHEDGKSDPCDDNPAVQPQDPVNDCVLPAEEALTEESDDEAEESGECQPAAPPPEGDGDMPDEGETDGMKEEDEETVEDDADDESDGVDGEPQDDVAAGEPDADESNGDADDSGEPDSDGDAEDSDAGQSDGDTDGGESDDAQSGADADDESDQDESSGDTDSGAPDEESGGDIDGDASEEGFDDDADDDESDEETGDIEGDAVVEEEPDSDSDTGAEDPEDVPAPADRPAEPADPPEEAGPGETAQPEAEPGEADDADAGGQTT